MFPSCNIDDGTGARARFMYARRGGLLRAAFWRAQGFPNCKLATAARMRYREERKRKAEEDQRALQLAGNIEVMKAPSLKAKPRKG